MTRFLLAASVLATGTGICMLAGVEGASAFTAAEQKQLYARCRAKYGKTPANIEIRGRTLVCVYGFDSNASEEEVRAACVKVHGPSVAPRVVKRRGKWTCIVTW